MLTNNKDWAWIGSMFNSDQWQPAFANAGLDFVTGDEDGMHQMRHLFASYMLTQGVSIKELAAYLGHTSEAFTLKTYVHLMPSSHQRARLAANLMFPPRATQAA
ncbi:tyrosine-type recombinase/integrase [Crossiella cryophila]|uniref:Integrase n=1 Tax=Crossiella cryophila TaxID=43355 RepID=A0A7W7CCX5_9PSEU|nr:tyrosine-type recombinase/integrase [Crossiella cryophila]MBB4678810.1 integrase [Crossiella cryophila]